MRVLLVAAYPWLAHAPSGRSLEARFPPPTGFVREALASGTFAAWLRGLPLKPGRPLVRLFDGRLKGNQSAHAAVVDIDVGARDLQQCADAVMRLRAEYLFSIGAAAAIDFASTSGQRLPFRRWSAGERPRVRQDRVEWIASAGPDTSHTSLRRYLDAVFTWAGSHSLAGDTRHVDVAELSGGDVVVQGGFPGHAVIVVDTARDAAGHRTFLLVQSYMPAQEMHVLRNPAREGAWFQVQPGEALDTPEWTFPLGSLRRFAGVTVPDAAAQLRRP